MSLASCPKNLYNQQGYVTFFFFSKGPIFKFYTHFLFLLNGKQMEYFSMKINLILNKIFYILYFWLFIDALPIYYDFKAF